MNLTELEIDECQKVFKDLDEEGVGSIKISDLKVALERIGFIPSEFDYYKMISEIDENNTGQIKFSDFLTIYHKHKMNSSDEEDTDTKDVFVAMGGNTDGTGSVETSKLVDIIKKEFELTIDIESLINEIDKDGSGSIELGELKSLFKTNYTNENL
jgi:Ca2+-binding EF-hand superfamily protein